MFRQASAAWQQRRLIACRSQGPIMCRVRNSGCARRLRHGYSGASLRTGAAGQFTPHQPSPAPASIFTAVSCAGSSRIGVRHPDVSRSMPFRMNSRAAISASARSGAAEMSARPAGFWNYRTVRHAIARRIPNHHGFQSETIRTSLSTGNRPTIPTAQPSTVARSCRFLQFGAHPQTGFSLLSLDDIIIHSRWVGVS